MLAKLVGAHMPIKNGLGGAVREGHRIGCTAIQVFTKSPQLWKSKPISDEMIVDFRLAVTETGLVNVTVHDSYLINMAAATEELREKSIAGLTDEMNRCAQYGIRFCNSHMGAHVGQGVDEGLRLLIEGAKQVLANSDPSVTLLMETTAATGTSLGGTFEQLRAVLDGLNGDPRVCVCLDTCHVFAAGYDLRTRDVYESTFGKFDEVIGLDRLKVIHCNDSLGAFGSKKDRHAAIGEGEIGADAFKMLVNDPRFENVPILLETPMENEGHEKDLAKLKSY
ncbi:MAG TPA: deoxyribonuclease IV [Fimbriimonas sp.]|nr:deoxyribonuclease IV [Fimbriimonas sp.]